MILHDNAGALIVQGNTLTEPKFKDGSMLKIFDYVVANPPFSDKRWITGLDPLNDDYERFKFFGVPPAKQGDYAYLLHIVRSLKSTGKGACILPHGVLFRGNAEAEIRRNLVHKGYIKGIIGLPANLFYGTGIPACIVVVDKENTPARKGIFMVDASKGFMKDGPKNRLRERDIHKIVDVFNKQLEIPKYSRTVAFEEIEKNEYNLNIPRYIDSTEPEDLQSIEGHLNGGIPSADVEALKRYWEICPGLRDVLFKDNRPGFVDLAVEKAAIRSTINEYPEFIAFTDSMKKHSRQWKKRHSSELKHLTAEIKPKLIISRVSEDILAHYVNQPLVDPYGIYQHLRDYWAETMQDDCYIITTDGWNARTDTASSRGSKKGKEKDKGWTCDLVPKSLIVAKYFAKDQAAIEKLTSELEDISAMKTELEGEHSGEDGAFSDLDRINKSNVKTRINEVKDDTDVEDELVVLNEWLRFSDKETKLKNEIKEADEDLDRKAYNKYPTLTEDEIKTLVVDDKWLAVLEARTRGEMDRISQTLTRRVKELAKRYGTPMPEIENEVSELEGKVNDHLERMGFSWG